MSGYLETLELDRNSRLQRIFDNDTTHTTITSPEGFKDICHNLRNTHRNFAKLWWNIHSLEHYIRNNFCPRGLRVQIFPAWEVTESFKNSWEMELQKCANSLLTLLLEHEKTLLSETKQELTRLHVKLDTFDSVTVVQPFLLKLRKELDELEDSLSSRKKSKFDRDRGDYNSGRAYKWRHTGNRRYPHSRHHTRQGSATNSRDRSIHRSSQSDFLSSSSEAEDIAGGPGPRDLSRWGPRSQRQQKRARIETPKSPRK